MGGHPSPPAAQLIPTVVSSKKPEPARPGWGNAAPAPTPRGPDQPPLASTPKGQDRTPPSTSPVELDAAPWAVPPLQPGAAPPSVAQVELGEPREHRFSPEEVVDGRYRLVRPIGKGGMAEVWLAQHETLRTLVAIKFALGGNHPDHRLRQEVVDRFRFEAQISARLCSRSNHIVAVHDAGAFRDVPYLVMELIEGRTLLDQIDERPLDPAQLAEILDDVADALSAAHAMDIIHRDIKPSNLMLVVSQGGRSSVKVADFGIAKSLRRDRTLDMPKETAMGFMIGTPSYMSPEQLLGDSGVDLRSDVWALGVVAYEALTGASPFTGDTLTEIVAAVSARPFASPSNRRPELPRGLDAWFDRALAKDKTQRFATVNEMARAFREAISAKAPPPIHAPRLTPRRVAVWTLPAALAAAALVGLFAWRALFAAPVVLRTLVHLPTIRVPALPAEPTGAAAPATAAEPAATTSVEAPHRLAPPPVTAAPPPAAPPLPAPAQHKELDPSEVH